MAAGRTVQAASVQREFFNWIESDLSLTPLEVRIMRILGLRVGSWTSKVDIARVIYGDDLGLLRCETHSLRTHISRIRRKLAGTPWRIENRYWHGLYRLVHRSLTDETED